MKVCTGAHGFTTAELGQRLRALESKRSPFAEPVKEKGAHWVLPELVAEVGFTEWTSTANCAIHASLDYGTTSWPGQS